MTLIAKVTVILGRCETAPGRGFGHRCHRCRGHRGQALGCRRHPDPGRRPALASFVVTRLCDILKAEEPDWDEP